MGLILAGVAAGAALGSLNHWLLARSLSVGRLRGNQPAGGLTPLFVLRYAIIAAALLAFWFRFRCGACVVALALAYVWTGRFLLHRTLRLGGDRP